MNSFIGNHFLTSQELIFIPNQVLLELAYVKSMKNHCINASSFVYRQPTLHGERREAKGKRQVENSSVSRMVLGTKRNRPQVDRSQGKMLRFLFDQLYVWCLDVIQQKTGSRLSKKAPDFGFGRDGQLWSIQVEMPWGSLKIIKHVNPHNTQSYAPYNLLDR